MKRLNRENAEKLVARANAGGLLPLGYRLSVARVEDIPALLVLGRAAFSYNPPTRREFKYAIEKAHAAIFMLRRAGAENLAAYLHLEGHSGRESLYTSGIAVAEDMRGQGLGQILYGLQDHIAMDLGARSLYSHVREGNTANIHLLEKNGYKHVRTENNYYDDGKTATLYKKDFTRG
jgi:ribosomal protein S18 acetylase RimI-like enzyme